MDSCQLPRCVPATLIVSDCAVSLMAPSALAATRGQASVTARRRRFGGRNSFEDFARGFVQLFGLPRTWVSCSHHRYVTILGNVFLPTLPSWLERIPKPVRCRPLAGWHIELLRGPLLGDKASPLFGNASC